MNPNRLQHKRIFCIAFILFLFLLTCIIISPYIIAATTFDRTALCNMKGYQGETITAEIKLKGDGSDTRIGYWKTYYRAEESDSSNMDITGWIDIQPVEYTIQPGETIIFAVNIHIPENASPGLYGALTEEAGLKGHAAERRTYVTFRDTPAGGNAYSGMMIPVSVQVNRSPNLFSLFVNFISTHLTYTIMAVIIIFLVILLLTGRKSGMKSNEPNG
jgi:hypothetical protein